MSFVVLENWALSVGLAILHSLWICGVIAAFGHGMLAWNRRRSSKVRHAIALSTLSTIMLAWTGLIVGFSLTSQAPFRPIELTSTSLTRPSIRHQQSSSAIERSAAAPGRVDSATSARSNKDSAASQSASSRSVADEQAVSGRSEDQSFLGSSGFAGTDVDRVAAHELQVVTCGRVDHCHRLDGWCRRFECETRVGGVGLARNSTTRGWRFRSMDQQHLREFVAQFPRAAGKNPGKR